MYELLQQIIANPMPSLIIVGNLILIESLLSVDNAAVLATMVMDLPEAERKKSTQIWYLGSLFLSWPGSYIRFGTHQNMVAQTSWGYLFALHRI